MPNSPVSQARLLLWGTNSWRRMEALLHRMYGCAYQPCVSSLGSGLVSQLGVRVESTRLRRLNWENVVPRLSSFVVGRSSQAWIGNGWKRWRAKGGEKESDVLDGREQTESDTDGVEEGFKSMKSGGVGFGTPRVGKQQRKATTVRRAAPSTPLIGAQTDSQAQRIETVVVSLLAFLGVLILAEGIALASSGFLPQEWDSFLVDRVYPTFTPTVGVFVAGAALYGVLKFLGTGGVKSK